MPDFLKELLLTKKGLAENVDHSTQICNMYSMYLAVHGSPLKVIGL